MNRSTEDKIIKRIIPLILIIGALVLAVFYSVRNSGSNPSEEQFSNITGLTTEELSFLKQEGFIQYQTDQGEELSLTNLKSPALIEQDLNTPEESFEVLATKLDLNQNTYQLAFKLENKTNQDKEFILIPVFQPEQLEFKQITGTIKKEKIVKNNIEKEPLDKLYDVEKHKRELKPELAKAYQDIDNNNYQARSTKLTLQPNSTLIAQSKWQVPGSPTSRSLEPVYFLVYGSAGGMKDELTILNVHSHPQAGDNWTVSFETKGTADLTITPTDRATIDDIEFISLKCGREERTPQILANDVISYPDWQCSRTGQITHLVNVAAKHTLKFQFGDQIVFAYNSPDTEILRPNGAGNETSPYIYQIPDSGEHWDKLDEASADDDDYVYRPDIGSHPNSGTDLYALSNHTGSGTINNITVYGRFKNLPGASKTVGYYGMRTHSTNYLEGIAIVGSTWTNFSHEWASNPSTESPWTWDEIDSLEAGVTLYYEGGAPPPVSIVKGEWVLMADGSQKNIENVQVGDEVLSFDVSTNSITRDKVIVVRKGSHEDYLIINGLKASLEHLIWASGEFESARDIEIGDFLLDSSGNESEVTQIEYVYDRVETYDLVIDKNRNFFASNYLVHNQAVTQGACSHLYVEVDYTPAVASGGLQIQNLMMESIQVGE